MIIKTVQTLVFEYPEDYQAEIEWNKKRDGDWVHQSTDTICSVYTITNRYLIPTKAKHSFVDNPYFEAEPQKWYKDEPQTDCRRCKHYATDKCKECFGHELFTDSGYATDCSWQKGE